MPLPQLVHPEFYAHSRWINRHLRPCARKRALTFVEALLAMAVGVVVMGSVVMAMNTITRGPARMADRSQARTLAEQTLNRLANELALAKVIYHVLDNPGQVEIQFLLPENLTGYTPPSDLPIELECIAPETLINPNTNDCYYPTGGTPLDGSEPDKTPYHRITRYQWNSAGTGFDNNQLMLLVSNIDEPYATVASRHPLLNCSKMTLELECEVWGRNPAGEWIRHKQRIHTRDAGHKAWLSALYENADYSPLDYEIRVTGIEIGMEVTINDDADSSKSERWLAWRRVECPDRPRLLNYVLDN
ncbi:MAG: hypothetical protein HJJLKODD_00576 [Phycisphaerae bacterium]|nr:hypothetical protein [Phycisphaerae bacterium]